MPQNLQNDLWQELRMPDWEPHKAMEGADLRRDQLEISMQRFAQLDVLRGVACLMVLVSHLRSTQVCRQFPDVGGIGVGIFFAMSGFLITSGLVEKNDLRRFYNRRICRILPIYFLTLLFVSFIWPRPEVAWAAAFCFNCLYVSGRKPYFETDSHEAPVGHCWSICVEEHFYLIWPLIVSIFPRRLLGVIPLLAVLLTPVSLSGLQIWLLSVGVIDPDVDDFLTRCTLTNLAAISIGAWAGLHREWILATEHVGTLNIPRCFNCGLCLMVVVGFSLYAGDLVPLACQPTIRQTFCAAIFLIVLGTPFVSRLPLLGGIGKISYGLYLFHLPIYALFGLTTGKPVGNLHGFVAVIITFLTAWASWHFIEQPAIRFGRDRLGRQWLGAALSVSLGLSAMATTCWMLGTQTSNVAEIIAPNIADSIDTVVIGPSHALDGVCTPLLKGVAYNLGTDAQDLWHTCQIANLSMQNCPQLRRIIIVLGWPFAFDYALKDQHQRRNSEPHSFDRQFQRQEKGLEHCLRFNRNVPIDPLPSRKLGVYFPDGPNRGWRMQPAQPFHANGAQIVESYETWRVPSFFDLNLTSLIELIRRAQKQNVDIILITTPMHTSYAEHFPENAVESFRLGSGLVLANTGVRIFDFTKDKDFVEADFKDSNHLNAIGARKFTLKLEAVVLKK